MDRIKVFKYYKNIGGKIPERERRVSDLGDDFFPDKIKNGQVLRVYCGLGLDDSENTSN